MQKIEYIPALGYNFLTPYYDAVVGLTTREKAFKTALVVQANIESDQLVLDLACGTATLTVLVKQTRPTVTVTGVDGDPKILEIAKHKASKAGLTIQFDTALSDKLPYDDAQFDRIISSLFFHHLTTETKFRTLLEVKRVLRPGGELHIADWGLPGNRPMQLASKFIQMLDGKETTDDNFTGVLPKLIEKSGFVNVSETSSFNTLFGTIRLIKAEKSK